MSKAGQIHKWEQGYQEHRRTQSLLSGVEPPARPLAVIHMTSRVSAENPRHAKPWFLVHLPARDEFVDEMVDMIFGRQVDGSPHTWRQG